MKRMFNRVVIVGVGLIGGSLAGAIKKLGLANEVIGVSRRPSTLRWAKRAGIIDRASLSLDAVKDADFVIFAAPVSIILKQAGQAHNLISRDCLVTDVGSTKAEIAAKLTKLFAGYAGSHPLAGSEKKGVRNFSPLIFKDTTCIVTKNSNTNAKAVNKLKKFWEKVGAKVLVMSPQKHDQILAFVSHLPHLAAFSLAQSVPGKYYGFTAGGFRDTTRIASSDACLWADILLSNRNNVLKSAGVFERKLKFLCAGIKRGDKERVVKFLSQAQKTRMGLYA